MRIVRVIVGMLLLTIGVPALFVGGALWTAAQHRDAGGAFSGSMQRIDNPGAAIIAPDLDALLARDAPFTRGGGTTLRLTVQTDDGPAFVGIAPAADVASYLAGLPYARVDAVGVGRGPLPVRVTRVDGEPGARPAPRVSPGALPIWLRQGVGAVDWTPDELRGQRLSMVIMRPDGRPATAVDVRAEVRPGWLDATSWGLITLGTLAIAFGMAVLAWPIRPREVVFVVEPGQVPVIAARLGARTLGGATVPVADTAGASGNPQPARHTPPEWPVPSARPTTLADTAAAPLAPPPAVPTLAWPTRPTRIPSTPPPVGPLTPESLPGGPLTSESLPGGPLTSESLPGGPLTPESQPVTAQVEAAAEPPAPSVPPLTLPPASWRRGPLPDGARTGDEAASTSGDRNAASSSRREGDARERNGLTAPAPAGAAATTAPAGIAATTAPAAIAATTAPAAIAATTAPAGVAAGAGGTATRPLPGLPTPAPAKRRRKTAGGLPAPDVLPQLVPPPNVPPLNVMTSRGGDQNRRRNAPKSTNGGNGARQQERSA